MFHDATHALRREWRKFLMGRRSSRLLAVFSAILLATLLPGSALASAPWLADCSGVSSSNQVCIYRDSHWTGNTAHMFGSNLTYANETWPSSTSAVNDSISSTKNLYSSYQVRWWRDPSYTGGYICNTPNSGFYSLSQYQNDSTSSHEVTQGAC
jgi:hypothetical protein